MPNVSIMKNTIWTFSRLLLFCALLNLPTQAQAQIDLASDFDQSHQHPRVSQNTSTDNETSANLTFLQHFHQHGDTYDASNHGLCSLHHGRVCPKTGIDTCYNQDLIDVLVGHASLASSNPRSVCTQKPATLQLPDQPYKNYFYSDCHSASQVVVTSPLVDSNLTIIGPRFLVAWPAGNSGAVTYFAPQNGINGTLSIEIVSKSQQFLHGVYTPPTSRSLTGNPRVGISTLLKFNSSATLSVPILGSIRTIRDFTEGPSLLHDVVQDANRFTQLDDCSVMLSRRWLDNITTTEVSFVPTNGQRATIQNHTIKLDAGTYNVTATFDFAQLMQLSAKDDLATSSQGLIKTSPDQTKSLSFLSYSEKLLAGAWRFLTYFGRDSMISLLLLQPILSEGKSGAIEAVISSVLDRLNRTSGVVCHEETIGDYATFVNLENNISSTAASCTYQMIDTDYLLAPVIENYFLRTETGRKRRSAFLATQASPDFGNTGLSYQQLAQINAELVMRKTAPFAKPGGQKKENLIHLEAGEPVGQWRDSTYGIGGGRIPFDVNTALVPAALRSIAALSAAGFFPEHPEWKTTAAKHAQVWEDDTLRFFEVTVPVPQARSLVGEYTASVGSGFPSHAAAINANVSFYGLALDGNDGQSLVRVMNTDDSFRHYLLNTTNQPQLTAFLNHSANNILRPYPVGLSIPQGIMVANPAYGGDPVYAQNWTNSAYHGTVVWSWPMAMMAAGLQRQLGRCASGSSSPDFCRDPVVHGNVLAAYNHLWDLIEANTPELSTEVWSWTYDNGFKFEPLGALPPPPGESPTESDIRQLWSLTFLAVSRDRSLRKLG